jgi:hypothetical protein
MKIKFINRIVDGKPAIIYDKDEFISYDRDGKTVTKLLSKLTVEEIYYLYDISKRV